jgi:hypothetical protein
MVVILIVEAIVIIEHQTMLRLQLKLKLLLVLEFMPLLLHLIIEFQFKHLKQLLPMVIIVKLMLHQLMLTLQLMLELLLKLTLLIMLVHLLMLELQLMLMPAHQREKRHLPFLLTLLVIIDQVLLTYLHLLLLLRKLMLNLKIEKFFSEYYCFIIIKEQNSVIILNEFNLKVRCHYL